MDSESLRARWLHAMKGTVYEKCIMHDGGKQMREKAVSRSREHSKDVALCGLFAALVAVGAIYQGCHSDRRRYHELHLAVVFRDAGSISAGLQTGIYQCGCLFADWTCGRPDLCTRRRSGVSAAPDLWFSAGISPCGVGHGKGL